MYKLVTHHSAITAWLMFFVVSYGSSLYGNDATEVQKYLDSNRSFTTPILTTSQVPDLLENTHRYNTSPHQQSNLVTALNRQTGVWWQYFVYWNGSREASITKRTFPDGTWASPVNIHAALGGDSLERDSHNTISVGVDKNGFIHVSGNHHSDPLNYARSTRPNDIGEFQNVRNMILTDPSRTENRVTYPTFFNTADGELMFLYRNQTVTSGSVFSTYLNRWVPETQSWVRVAQLASGKDLRFYTQRIAIDNTQSGTHGRIHIMAMWRNDAGSGSETQNNEDIFHLFSDDNGVSWQQYGSAQSLNLPLGYGDIELILDTRPHPNSRYMVNQSGLELDSTGNPHALLTMSDREGSRNHRYYHIWFDGSRWNTKLITQFTPGSRSSIISTRSGEVFGFFRRGDSQSSRFELLNLTPGSSRYDSEVITLSRGFSDAGSSPNYDAGALNHHNKLAYVASRSPIRPEVGNRNLVQDATIVQMDLNQIDGLRNNTFLQPDLTVIDTSNDSSLTFSQSGVQKIFNSRAISISNYRRPAYGRLTIRASAAGSTSAQINLQFPTSSGTTSAGHLDFSGSEKTLSTGILPLLNFTNGTVDVMANLSGGSNLNIRSIELQILRASAPQFPLNDHMETPPATQTEQPNTTSDQDGQIDNQCVDTDGDGWGWNGVESCTTTSPNVPLNDGFETVNTTCVDNDGDGWGWDGSNSCQTSSQADTNGPPELLPEPGASTCLDFDGDGWGWNGTTTCLVNPDSATSSTSQETCIDHDGDGWGWNGVESCVTNGAESTPESPSPTPLQCVDNDGDGWGWDGSNTCRVTG